MENEAVQHYKLLKGAFPAEEGRILKTYLPALFLILAAGMIVSIFLGISRGYRSQITLTMTVFTGLYLGYVAWALPRKLRKRLAKCWDTYDLEIGPDYFLRRQADTPDLQIKSDEITRVERLPGRYLRIIGKDKQRVIGIPEGIERFEEVLHSASSGHTVSVRSGEIWQRRILYMACGAAAFITMLWSTAPYLFTPLAVGLFLTVVWAVWSVQRNPNASRQTRRAVWWYLLVLIPCVQRISQGLNQILKR